MSTSISNVLQEREGLKNIIDTFNIKCTIEIKDFNKLKTKEIDFSEVKKNDILILQTINIKDNTTVFFEYIIVEKIENNNIYTEFLYNIKNNAIGGIMLNKRALSKERSQTAGAYRYNKLYKVLLED